MKPERWHQVDELLSAVLERESAERPAFLASACHGDDELKKQVELLLRAHERAEGFLEPPSGQDSSHGRAAHRVESCIQCLPLLTQLGDLPTDAASSSPGEAPLARGATLGRYVVLERIGEGGMGIVFSAYDPELDRKVAIKLLRALPLAGGDARARLLREAQATARLQHPNVVAIHDVGEVDGRLFAAMEFVEGATVRQWLKQAPRSWREILHTFVQAGQGLAAAHRKGLVHRDFKPDNVLVDAEGRVKVADFGLARAVGEATLAAPMQAEGRSGSLDVPLTRTGMVLGTPAYMAPEQRHGGKADARTDQYSFCVALFEALYGQRPSEAPDPSSSPVPTRIRAALLRGLKEDPDQRYTSMDALLDDLQRQPLVTVPRVAAAVLVVGVLAFAGWRLTRPLCAGGEEAWGDVWSASRREAARTAFGSLAKEFAQVDAGLNTLKSAWISMRTDACLATRRRGDQSETLLDLRMQCLGDRRREAEALAQLFQTASASVAIHAPEAVDRLKPLSACADARALTSRLPPPKEAEGRARVEEAKALAAKAQALLDTSQWGSGIPAAEGAVEAARRSGYKPVEAEALRIYAVLLYNVGRGKEAPEAAHGAAAAAIEGRDDGLAADAFNLLVVLEGFYNRNSTLGDLWSRYARATIQRMGGDLMREADLEFYLAQSYQNITAKVQLSLEHRRKALELYTKANAPEVKLAYVQGYLGVGEALAGNLEEGLRLMQSATEIQRRLGREDGRMWANLGNFLLVAGRPQEARAPLERAIELTRAGGGPTSWILAKLAWASRESGEPDAALRLDQQSLEQYEKQADARELHSPLMGMGEDLIALRRPKEAIAPLERALRFIDEKKVGPGWSMGRTQFALARALWDSGIDRKRAVALAREARSSFQTAAETQGALYARFLKGVDQWLREREAPIPPVPAAGRQEH